MPTVYSNADLALIPLSSKSFVCPIYTQGFTITNYSDVPFLVQTDDALDMGVVLPYFTRTYAAKKGDVITLTPQPLMNAQVMSSMFVSYDISNVPVSPAIVPLAQVSGYQMNVAGNMTIEGTPSFNIANTPSVVISGTPSVGISGTPNVAVSGPVAIQNTAGGTLNVGGSVTVGNTALNVQNAAGGTLNVAGAVTIANTPSVSIANTVNANITSGSVSANITNASINAAVVNAMTSPVNVQQPLQTMTNIGTSYSAQSTPVVSTLLGSGGRLQFVHIIYNNNCGYYVTFVLANNGNQLHSAGLAPNTSATYDLNFLAGITNNGITLTMYPQSGNYFSGSAGGYLLS